MKQKEKNSRLLFIALLSIFFIFLLYSSPYAATCDLPGDFVGLMGDPTPDGKVDFNDLMVFATAYGSETGDPNWNVLCDICGYLGDPNPDGKVNFDDLMVFATNYGKSCQAIWTVMVYLDGDNSLDYSAWDDLSEMESIGSSNEINIITQVDLYNSCLGTYRYFVTGAEQGSTYPLYSNDIVQTLPEQNMADPAVLNNFINWGINNYPANHYILILWNHGGGWREENIFMKGIIVDDTSNDFLTMAELVQGLENIEEPLDIIGFDACLMQMVEVYYEIGSSITSPSPPGYGIGSEESEWGDGWPYDLILADLISNPSMSESTFCETTVNDYISYCGSVGTLSALYFSPEITQSTEVLNAIDSFANALMNSAYQTEINLARSSAQSYSYADYKDFYDFAQIIKNNVPDCQSEAQAIMDLINTVVISEAHTGFSVDNSHGLSIYLPDSSGDYDSSYDTLQFAIDSQWDEFLRSGPNVVTDIGAQAMTYQGTSMEMFQVKMDKLVEEELIPDSFHLNELPPLTKGVTEHAISVGWHSYPDATGYKVFRSVNGGSFSLIFQDEPTGYDYYGFYDYNVSEGSSYTYYVTTYGSGWETDPSQTVTIDTWLPPCSLISPTDESIITDPTPTFTWNPVGLTPTDFPYGSIVSGHSDLDVWDKSVWEHAWWFYFDDLTTASAVYNQDNTGDSLQISQGYSWNIDSYGYDTNNNLIAYSWSEGWEFVYSGGANAGVTEVEAEAETYVSESMMMQYLTEIQTDWPGEGYIFNEPEPAKAEVNHDIWIMWKGFCETSGYGFKIYRSINGGSFEVIFSGTAPIGYSWYGFIDNPAGPGNTYTYYVTAYGPDWESDPSPEVTIDTWLPPCSLISPTDDSLISDPNPAFDWDPVITDFPYGSLVYGRTCMLVYDNTISDFTWIVCTGDPNISTVTYNQDGDSLPLVNGHNYSWHCWNSGYDENWNRIAVSESIDWHFDYIGP